jgi:E3 ubiquitin-protein ligase NRDP1
MVFLIANIGTISFSLNGEFMGIAFRSDYLKKGPIYAAVALLHCAGCTLRVGMPKPSYMD